MVNVFIVASSSHRRRLCQGHFTSLVSGLVAPHISPTSTFLHHFFPLFIGPVCKGTLDLHCFQPASEGFDSPLPFLLPDRCPALVGLRSSLSPRNLLPSTPVSMDDLFPAVTSASSLTVDHERILPPYLKSSETSLSLFGRTFGFT